LPELLARCERLWRMTPDQEAAESRDARAAIVLKARDPRVSGMPRHPFVDVRVADARLHPVLGWRWGQPNQLLSGDTRRGKTLVARALALRLWAELIDDVEGLDLGMVEQRAGIYEAKARHLAFARRHHALGRGEPPIVVAAKRASLLLLEDLGKGDDADFDGLIFDVIDHRYDRSLPTIITSGWLLDVPDYHGELDPAHTLIGRYGREAMGRFLTRANVVEAW
jgi:hypothetical protein